MRWCRRRDVAGASSARTGERTVRRSGRTAGGSRWRTRMVAVTIEAAKMALDRKRA